MHKRIGLRIEYILSHLARGDNQNASSQPCPRARPNGVLPASGTACGRRPHPTGRHRGARPPPFPPRGCTGSNQMPDRATATRANRKIRSHRAAHVRESSRCRDVYSVSSQLSIRSPGGRPPVGMVKSMSDSIRVEPCLALHYRGKMRVRKAGHAQASATARMGSTSGYARNGRWPVRCSYSNNCFVSRDCLRPLRGRTGGRT